MQNKNPGKFYVTTPIYYVNDAPHIGHAYTTVLADVLARYHRLLGDETFFLTGTDEHGQKVQQAANAAGRTAQEHCDIYSARFKDAWKDLEISNDRFIRTTDPDHVLFLKKITQKLWDEGHIYASEYEGWYSTSEERFFTEKELVDGMDPISHRPVEKIKEKNYFFRMSDFQQWLLDYIEQNPDFILPEFRRNEVLGFLQQPLNDLCISRPKSRLGWGIPLPFDEEYVMYVWVDALFNYCSGVDGKKDSKGNPYWPADLQLIGKDILTTHAVYWPTMLKAVGLPLPKHILAHGWWLMNEARMSKTTGNVVNPLQLKEKYGVDPFRFYLIRDMAVGHDASFTEEAFIKRIDSDLANDFGNALNRVLHQSKAHLESRISKTESKTELEVQLATSANGHAENCLNYVRQARTNLAIEEILQLVRQVNRFLEASAPWKMNSDDPEQKEKLKGILFHAAECLRMTAVLLHPVMPGKMTDALQCLGFTPQDSSLSFGSLNWEKELQPKAMLFPRITQKKVKNGAQNSTPADPFAILDIKVGEIVSVANHPQADSLYVLTIGLGAEQRQLCAGLRENFNPEQLTGKKVPVLANLKPAKLRGVESRGMMLVAEDKSGKPFLIESSENPGKSIFVSGIKSTPKTKITLKDFEKCPLFVDSGRIIYQDKPLSTDSGNLQTDAPNKSQIR